MHNLTVFPWQQQLCRSPHPINTELHDLNFPMLYKLYECNKGLKNPNNNELFCQK